MTKTALERFEAKVMADPNSGCWLWSGAVQSKGYGIMWLGGNKWSLAHRFAYEQFVGPIPDGLHIDHKCRTRGCVNPKHLEPVTSQENMARGLFGPIMKTHCPHGHELTPENIYTRRGTKIRECRRCRGAFNAAWRRAH